jgi:ABC-type multidrug transport system ATPase subunit
MIDALLEPVVRAQRLCVRFGDRSALSDVSLSLDAGRVLAVVGANGAGKSTLFRALLGLVPTRSGEATLFGHPASELSAAVRARVAYVSEEHAELPQARLRELIAFRRQMYRSFDEAPLRALLDRARIDPAQRFGELSRGQRAQAVVGLALAQSPDLLMLDDPTLGLDPLARRSVVQAVLALARDAGTTVLIATHEIADVERLADEILLLSRGRVAAPAQDIESFVGDARAVTVETDVAIDALRSVEAALYLWPRRAKVEVIFSGDEAAISRGYDQLVERAGERAVVSEPRAVSLEEVTLAWLARDSEEADSHE